jgi:acyl-CoA reductase-like NAD-dependent aldehyde dehydrogenase
MLLRKNRREGEELEAAAEAAAEDAIAAAIEAAAAADAGAAIEAEDAAMLLKSLQNLLVN